MNAAKPRLPPGFGMLLAAQFVSALADNALLIVTMALLHRQGHPAWWAPVLKLAFTVSYVLLAPVLGPFADALAKSRLMMWMNGVKAVGVCALVLGANPVLAYCVVGLGAAGYAPAKYGLTTELVPPEGLVAANGWLEVTVVGAVLLGAALGGALISPVWMQATLTGPLPLSGPAGELTPSLLALLTVYALSAMLNLGVPDSGARYARSSIHPVALWRDFLACNARLWRDAEGGLSLGATTVFWGAGATLQFIVLRWADVALGLPLHQGALLQAVVAVGVLAGAGAAGRFVRLDHAKRMLGLGIGLGLLLPLLALCRSPWAAAPLLVAGGAIGGLMVVPLNALLQHRGLVLLSAGRSVAVQGFNENLGVLVMLALYTSLLAMGTSIQAVMWAMGLMIAMAIAALMLLDLRRAARGASGHSPRGQAGQRGVL